MIGKLIRIIILVSISSSALAGSGAGGIIRVENLTKEDIRVSWSGTGCVGISGGLTVVCEDLILKPEEGYTYKYNWGVTSTWINIARNSYTETHGCAFGHLNVGDDLCIADHHRITTVAYDTHICRLRENLNSIDKFSLICSLDN